MIETKEFCARSNTVFPHRQKRWTRNYFDNSSVIGGTRGFPAKRGWTRCLSKEEITKCRDCFLLDSIHEGFCR